ncbi:TPA: hypothetical protein ACH3X1_008296 [Trebouxia sp. C0004]
MLDIVMHHSCTTARTKTCIVDAFVRDCGGQIPLPDHAKGLQGDSQTKDITLMPSVMDGFMARLLAGSPDTLDFPSSWWDNSPESATSDICQRLTDAGYLIIPAFEDSVCFIALSALQRHFVGNFQRGQQQATTGATGLKANQGNLSSTQPGNRSASPLSTAAASTPGQPPKAPCCKDCTMALLASITGHGAVMDRDQCSFQPGDNQAAKTLRAILTRLDEVGQTTVKLLLRVYCCGQNLCITLIEASGDFQSLVKDRYLVQSVHVSIEAESSGEPIPLAVYLQRSQEPCQLQSCDIKTVRAAHRVGHDLAHRDIAGDPKQETRSGIIAKADEELVLSRLFSNSDALSQGTTIELKRYIDRSYNNNETQFSTLSFDGWGDDPVLFKGQLLGRLDAAVKLQCSAVVNIGAMKKKKSEQLLRANPSKTSKLWAKVAPQQTANFKVHPVQAYARGEGILQMSFEVLPDELLPAVFSHLSPGMVLKVSLVCKRFAQGCEVSLAQICAINKWVMPRKPRGQAAKQHHFPIRAMYRRHACISCGELGEFPVRSGHTAGTKQAPILFLVCKR